MDAQQLPMEEQAKFAALGVPIVEQDSGQVADLGKDPDLIVLSPGVPWDLPMVAAARARGVAVTGEVELAHYFLAGPVIGITGSNGKTTTTALTGHLLKECGIPCQVGGNIGTAVTSLVASSKEEQWNVVELSSFQLESIQEFRAAISCCLNVTPDHLDRHGSVEAYAAAKARLFQTQTSFDRAVLNFDDAMCRSFAQRTKAEVFWFSSSRPVPQGVSLEGDQLLYCGEPFARRSQIQLRGMHNVENAMAAALMAHLAGAPLEDLGKAIETFPGVEHRIEFVRELDGVKYYNDSKATNVDAAVKAVRAFPERLWIILGGKDKGSGYEALRAALREHARSVMLIGEPAPYPYAAAPIIRQALEGVVPLVDSGTLAAATRYARQHAEPGEVVLLSPACASFDQFANYEERGRAFKQVVAELF